VRASAESPAMLRLQSVALNGDALTERKYRMKNAFVVAPAVLLGTMISMSAQAQVIQGTGPYNGPGGFDRGFQSTQHCGNSPESWIRGSASLDKGSGVLNVQVQAETDSTSAGPKGKVLVAVRNASGQDLADVQSDEFGRGGKPPGHAAMSTANKTTTLAQSVASRATSLYVVAQCTGTMNQLWGISGDQLNDALKVVVTAVGAAGG
jgi:hypothetical protein